MRACILLVLAASVAVASVEGVAPDAYLSISNDDCDQSRLKWPCPGQCSLEIQPVYATCEHGRLETFINCCTWHRDVCQFRRREYRRRKWPQPLLPSLSLPPALLSRHPLTCFVFLLQHAGSIPRVLASAAQPESPGPGTVG
ncbi:uncharacterized protein LOC126267613 [Schistocerca gregaria]|uniref:uncharacterized protein LOC126267613 n=1 Tax=Schistocerca gregaria TaxID=7010 RepID=UPI00211F3CDF|nr:uncharacterized protein LOC126267613 [Schistocerca gregaria]